MKLTEILEGEIVSFDGGELPAWRKQPVSGDKVVNHPLRTQTAVNMGAAEAQWNDPSPHDQYVLLHDLSIGWGYLSVGDTSLHVQAAEKWAISNGYATPEGEITWEGQKKLMVLQTQFNENP